MKFLILNERLFSINIAEGVAVVVIVVNCDHLERSSIECLKTKTEVVTTANLKEENYLKGPMRTQSKTNRKRGKTRITKS